MVGLRSGLNTLRYWRRVNESTARNGAKIDRAALEPRFLAMRLDGNAILSELRRRGICVIPDYWSSEKCAAARAEIERIIVEYPDCVQKYSNGADSRMFGVESVSPLLNEFHTDAFARGVGELLSGVEFYNFATLAGRIQATSRNEGSGEGWHRDGHGFQFKSILYLSDVSEKNGPFEFLPGSHSGWRTVFDTVIGDLPPAPASRYSPALVDGLIGRFGIAKHGYTATAGTLILVNTAGIHRGRPLETGERYALTNYYFHSFQINEERIRSFSPLMPGAADRVRADLGIGG
jgi:hypothetical protein